MSARARGLDTAIDLAALLALKAAIGTWVLHAGFTHVSDDDYARVVITEAFAHAPKLDPSGTSWLPFPFWLNGLGMLALGRSLAIARGLAIALAVAAVAAPYAAMRAVGCRRVAALAGVAVAMATPWSAWLGVATVPEALTACLVAAGAVAVTSPRARAAAAAGLLAAALSRYEAWPACAVFALACAWPAKTTADAKSSRSASGTLGSRAVPIALAVLGPLAWMAWNAHAHGSPVHFLARVAAYRQAIGAAPASLTERLTELPWAVVTASPAIVIGAALGAPALALDASTRARWAWPLASALAILVFLVVGDIRDGAPTHHPERAVVPIAWILAAFAADALDVLVRRSSRPRWVAGALAVAGVAWAATLPGRWADHPAASLAESRETQITRGLALAAEGTAAPRLLVTPCAYEHFALIAAFAAPERVDIGPATHGPVTEACPRVERP